MPVATEYGYGVTTSLGFEQAKLRVRETLKEQGFGVLTEIDIRAALKEKLGVEFPEYAILGACNPNLAYRALQQEPEIGLLLPCNVVVRRREGKTEVLAVDAEKMLAVVNRPELASIATEANQRLRAALDRM